MLNTVIRSLPALASRKVSIAQGFDAFMSEHIEHWSKKGHQTSYLMRLRKALLALQDF